MRATPIATTATRLLLAASLAATAASCASSSTGPPSRVDTARQEASRDTTLTLAVGATGRVAPGLKVTFREVEQDSRCPADVVCVTAGDVDVWLKVEAGARAMGPVLHLNAEPRTVEMEGYVVRLDAVQPYPRSSHRTEPGAYVATLTVTRPGR